MRNQINSFGLSVATVVMPGTEINLHSRNDYTIPQHPENNFESNANMRLIKHKCLSLIKNCRIEKSSYCAKRILLQSFKNYCINFTSYASYQKSSSKSRLSLQLSIIAASLSKEQP